jgi:hypothetical protein
MILTREEMAFLDVYCHEGTEPPFGGPATHVMTRLGVQSGDTLNLQSAYLRDMPPTGPVIGHACQVAPPLPWADREAVLRRDAEIRALREQVQRERSGNPPGNPRNERTKAEGQTAGKALGEMPRQEESGRASTES